MARSVGCDRCPRMSHSGGGRLRWERPWRVGEGPCESAAPCSRFFHKPETTLKKESPEPTWETKRWPGPREVCAAFLGGSTRLSLALAHGPQLARCRYLCPTSSSGPRVIPGPEVYGSHTWLVPGLPDCPPPPPLPPPPWAWRPPWWAGWVQPQGRASGRGLQGWDWPGARCRGPPSVRHGPQHQPRAAAHSAALSTRGTFLALECPCSRGHPSWGGVLSDSLLVAADTVRRSLSSAFSSVDPLPGPR